MDSVQAMSADELSRLKVQVAKYNAQINNGKVQTQSLGKDDFLKILLTQLSHQDPTQPMEDRDFIAQMAQFSSLEQMTNMNEGLAKVAALVAKSQAVSLLGSTVEVATPDQTITGVVDEVTNGDLPQLLVNGQYYDASQVQKVKTSRADPAEPGRIGSADSAEPSGLKE